MKIQTIFTVAFMIPSLSFGDSPLPSPSLVRNCPESGNFCVVSDPKAEKTKIISKVDERELWSIVGWYAWSFVSEDGIYAAMGYPGMNLVPRDVSIKEPVFWVYKQGKLKMVVKLSDLYRSVEEIPETTSHRVWLSTAYFNKSGSFVIELDDDSKKSFDLSDN